MTAPVAAVCGSAMAPGRQETTLQPYSVRSRGEAGTVNSSATSPSTTSRVASWAADMNPAVAVQPRAICGSCQLDPRPDQVHFEVPQPSMGDATWPASSRS
jgi:hypothetical protein